MIILFFFILLMQRQNVIICLLLFFNIGILSNIKKIKISIKNITCIILGIMLLLYVFRVVGNIRYGKEYERNDTSMIEKVGRISSSYPQTISKQFFWSYVYIVTPLVNLNYNVRYFSSIDETNYLFRELLPDIISNKLFFDNKFKINLP